MNMKFISTSLYALMPTTLASKSINFQIFRYVAKCSDLMLFLLSEPWFSIGLMGCTAMTEFFLTFKFWIFGFVAAQI